MPILANCNPNYADANEEEMRQKMLPLCIVYPPNICAPKVNNIKNTTEDMRSIIISSLFITTISPAATILARTGLEWSGKKVFGGMKLAKNKLLTTKKWFQNKPPSTNKDLFKEIGTGLAPNTINLDISTKNWDSNVPF